VYAAKEIAIFDDVLSGLDSTTMLEVFHGVFGSEGLLRQRKTTVVLATHAGILPAFRLSS
jgi:ATP-binding cassette, subfamily C (CFTR/MRP), member 1